MGRGVEGRGELGVGPMGIYVVVPGSYDFSSGTGFVLSSLSCVYVDWFLRIVFGCVCVICVVIIVCIVVIIVVFVSSR